jgi:hypothetical protein
MLKGKSPAEAAFAAREISSDFLRSGAKTRAVNKVSAFFNAKIQGIDKLGRTFRDNPARTTFKVMLYTTLPSIILYFLNRDEEGWDEIPQWQKDLFWLVKIGDTWWRIPKPFEYGLIFGSLPERFLEYLDKKDPESMREIGRTIASGVIPNPMPTGVTPVLENLFNYSFFLDRPIVSRGLENLPPEEQYTRTTSEIAKMTGAGINVSPAKIDNLIRGYFAGLGTYALNATDQALKGTGVVVTAPEPTKTLSDMPAVKAFVVRDPKGSSGVSVDKFYEARDKATKHHNKVNLLLERGQVDKAREYIAENPDVKLYSDYNKIADVLSEIRNARDAIYDDKEMSPEVKRQKLDKLDEISTNLTHGALNIELK